MTPGKLSAKTFFQHIASKDSLPFVTAYNNCNMNLSEMTSQCISLGLSAYHEY